MYCYSPFPEEITMDVQNMEFVHFFTPRSDKIGSVSYCSHAVSIKIVVNYHAFVEYQQAYLDHRGRQGTHTWQTQNALPGAITPIAPTTADAVEPFPKLQQVGRGKWNEFGHQNM